MIEYLMTEEVEEEEDTLRAWITQKDRDEKAKKMIGALRDLIDGCGEYCEGCPIVMACEDMFKMEPWKWGRKCGRVRRKS